MEVLKGISIEKFLNWAKRNPKVFIYACFIFLFCWYINPIVEESRNKNKCAKVVGARIYDESKSKEILKLDKSKIGSLKFWRQARNYCKYYKSAADDIYINGDVGAEIRGVIGTQEYRRY